MNGRHPNWFGPGLAAAMLVALVVLHTLERGTAGNIDHYMAQVAEQIDAVPDMIGPYYGRDAEVAPGAVRVLRPNRIFQKRFINPDSATREWFSLLLVHCKVAKDMNNHYPPNCYPNSGWELTEPAADVTVRVGELRITAKRYRFGKPDDLTAEPMDILSFFVLPSGTVRYGGEMNLVDMSSRTPWTDKLGAGQVQVLTPVSMSEELRESIWERALEAIAPALHRIAEGPA